MDNFYPTESLLPKPKQIFQTKNTDGNNAAAPNIMCAVAVRQVSTPVELADTAHCKHHPLSQSATFQSKSRLIPSLVLFLFTMCLYAHSQDTANTQAVPADGQPSPIIPEDGLKIGDQIPEEVWNMPLQVVNHPEGKESITLRDYKDKLIIIDFWATWCVPCIKSLYKLDTLQKQVGDYIAVIPSTFEDAEKIDPFITKRGWTLPTAVSEIALKQYFPHQIVPHQVWIKNNTLRAIVNHDDATIETINEIMNNHDFTLHTKKDILDYSRETNIAVYADRVNSPILFSSTITGHINGISAGFSSSKHKHAQVISYANAPLITMYRRALRENFNKILLNGNRVLQYAIDTANVDYDKIYNYQLILPEETPKEAVKERILKDLNDGFQLKLDSQTMIMECFVITEASRLPDKKNATANQVIETPKNVFKYKLSSFVKLLNFTVNWTSSQPIYINEATQEREITVEPYQLLQKDPERLKSALLPYSLTVLKEKRPIQMYILTDNTAQ